MTRSALMVIPIVMICSSAIVHAGASKQWSRCRNERIEPTLRIEACSALLACDYMPEQGRAIILSNRASAYGDAHEAAKAISDYDEALKLQPDLSEALNGRCWVRAAAGRELTLALKDCDAALALAPGDADALDSRGFVHVRLKLWRKAIADYTAALEAKPDEASSLYGRGIARLASGDKTHGEADIAKAKSLDAKVAEEFAAMGIAPDIGASPGRKE